MPRDIPVGNGELLINFDEHYQIRDVYYPRVGMANHTNGEVQRFGVWADGEFAWSDDPGWTRQMRYKPDTMATEVVLQSRDLQIELLCSDVVDFASPIFFGTVVTLLATLEKRLKTVQRGLISVAGVWLGRTSYSMYLFHLLIIYLFFPDPSVNDLPLFLGILLLFCTVFYWVLENPILELRPKYKRE